MKDKISKIIIGMLLAISTLVPSIFVDAFAAESFYVVDDNVVSDSNAHYFTYTAAKDVNGEIGWADDLANFGDGELKSQHWVWNANNTEASKHSYTFTFVGTGVELVGITPTGSNRNIFTLDAGTAETLAIDATAAKKETVIYTKKGLPYGTHTVQVTLPNDGTQKGLQISYARVYGVKDTVNESIKILPNKKDGTINKFVYHAPAGSAWSSDGTAEAYIDMKTNSELTNEAYYEIPFIGNSIEIFANKSFNHGKMEFSVDGEIVQIADLYNSSRTTPQSVYKVEDLKEGSHTLKAVLQDTKSGSSFVGQVAYAKVGHAPYKANDIVLAQDAYEIVEGATQKITYTVDPDYAELTDITFSSDNEEVASVSDEGVITANNQGTASITVASAYSQIKKVVSVTVQQGNPQMGGSIVDTNTRYNQSRYAEVKGLGTVSASVTAWKNDKAISAISLYSKDSALRDVTVSASDFKNGSATIAASNIKSTFLKSTKAYNGPYLGYGSTTREIPADNGTNRSESNDILYQDATKPINVDFNSLQNVWVELNIPKDAKPGTYTGTLSVSAKGITTPLVFTYTVKVQDATLKDATEFKDSFDIELWQYPYSSAEYYGVEPFSQEHIDILRTIMEEYKEVGGHVITATILEEAWAGQTFSKNDVHYPSMVKWTKNADGSFSYDYDHFDKWVTLNKELGIGDKIVLYSIAPWHNSFTYWENGVLKYESFSAGSARYTEVWTAFLQNMTEHLMEKGWFDDAYVGIDERGFTKAAFDTIDSVKNIHGKSMKTAGSFDSLTAHADLAMRVTDLNVGDTSATGNPAAFADLLKKRNDAGLRTALYTCTEHEPGNFSLSSPVESYWMVANDAKIGGTGIMRWAYDAWVADPLVDTTHNAFEPGDCFLIYPDRKDAKNPVVRGSVRLDKISEGVRDVNKLKMMEAEIPALKSEIAAIYANISGVVETKRQYLTETKINELIAQSTTFKTSVEALTERYIELKEGGTDQVESVVITESDQSLSMGYTLQLHAKVNPSNVLNTAITWSSSEERIATVSSSGVVSAISTGDVVITATSQQDPTKTATIRIAVSAPSIEPAAQVAYYSFNDETARDAWGTRNGTVNGASFANGKAGKALYVASEGKNVTFNQATGLNDTAPWSVSYWVNTESDFNKRISVMMDSEKVYSLDLKMDATREAGYHMGKNPGDVMTFRYPFAKDTWYNVTWTNSKTDGMCMYVNGKLVQKNTGATAFRTILPLDILGGTGFTGYIDEVKVYNKVLNATEVNAAMLLDGLNLTETNKDLYIGDSYKIITNLNSQEADKTITYTSSDTSIATVDEQGNVTAIKRGNAIITVENKAGGYKDFVNISISKRLNITNKLPVNKLPEENLSDIEKAPGTNRQYLGQPDMVRTKEGRLITVYPIGHGKGPLVMQISDDNGTTWTEKKDIPSSWSGSQETPTMYRLDMGNGKERIMIITACPGWGTDNDGNVTGWNTSYSDDNGNTWTQYAHWHSNHPDGTANKSIVGMASLVQLKDANGNFVQKWMAVYHDYDYINYKTYLTFDENGKEEWSAPVKYLDQYRDIEKKYQICEVGMFRSPDGTRIVGLSRSQSHNNPATLIYSDDEGQTWSKPMDLPGSLAGERHKATYDPITGRLVITFREIKYDLNGNNKFDGDSDWLAGDWVAWVGTYEDLMEQNEGQYRILLCEDWANNAKSGDTGYAGVVVLADGTFIMDTYGHWDKDFSLSWTGGVTSDLCYIKQAKFKLAEVDNLAGLINRNELINTINELKDIVNDNFTPESWENFRQALQKAAAVNIDKGSSQIDIDKASAALKLAHEQLTKGETEDTTLAKSILKSAIDKAIAAEASAEFKTLAPSVQTLIISMRTAAQAVYADAAATNAQCVDAWIKLANALQFLDFQADKAALLEVIKTCNEINTDEYIEGVEEFEAALANAQSVYDNANALQASIDAARIRLQEAKDHLVKEVANKDLLASMISAIEKQIGDGSKYKQDENWKAFAKALAEAKAVVINATATQEVVDAALLALNDTYLNIRLLPSEEQLAELNNFLAAVKGINRRIFTSAQLAVVDETANKVKVMINDFDANQFAATQKEMATVLDMIDDVTAQAPSKPGKPGPSGSMNAAQPNTGDNTNIAALTFAILVSGYAGVWIRRRHNKKA